MKNSNQKVTIVTVTYNAQEYLEQTIKGVIEQDYKNIEYIIIDGASTDDTVEIIKRYEKYISYWVSEPDNGVYDAMNKGIDIATGELVNFMNAGDSFVNNHIVSEVLQSLLEETDILVGGINVIDQESNQLEYKKFEGPDNLLKYNPCYHQASFAKLSLLKKSKFDLKYTILSDYNFMLHCYMEKCNFQHFSGPIANYLTGGLSETNVKQAFLEGLIVLYSHLQNPDIVLNSYWSMALSHNGENLNFSRQFNYMEQELKYLDRRYSKIAIYGYGKIGKYVESILKNKIHIICDSSFSKVKDNSVFCTPDELKTKEFDLVIICVLGREKELKDYLLNQLQIDENLIYEFKL